MAHIGYLLAYWRGHTLLRALKSGGSSKAVFINSCLIENIDERSKYVVNVFVYRLCDKGTYNIVQYDFQAIHCNFLFTLLNKLLLG